jgi:hypothetical protein
MTHRLRHDTRIFASGFFLTRDEIQELAQRALSPDFLASHWNDAFLAFKWHIRAHSCEVITTSKPNRFLVAVHFFPWVVGELVPRKLADIPKERRELWSKHYGQHVPDAKYPMGMVAYPMHLGGTSDRVIMVRSF